MDIKITEELDVNGTKVVDWLDVGFSHPGLTLTRLQLATELNKLEMFKNFKDMIRSIAGADMPSEHKVYINELLISQLDMELVSAYSAA